MRQLRNLNVTESIEQNHLVYDEKWYEKIDLIFILFSFGVFVCLTVLMLNIPFNNTNDKGFVFFFNLPITFLLGYVAYRKLTEKRLIKISTNFDDKKNKEIVLKFAEEKEYEIFQNSENLLILNEPSSTLQFNDAYKKTTVLIFQNNKILFTIIKDSYRLNLPVLTTHLILKYDLKKLLNKAE